MCISFIALNLWPVVLICPAAGALLLLSEGGPNDFYSNGDYWWPDPSKIDGLPYINRDGQVCTGAWKIGKMYYYVQPDFFTMNGVR